MTETNPEPTESTDNWLVCPDCHATFADTDAGQDSYDDHACNPEETDR